MIRPGLTTATQYSGAPFPLPIPLSSGFFVTGLSGKMRIQTLPPRLTKRVIAIRPASIWRSVIQPASSTFKPKSPNSSVEPRQALPRMRPRCCLRYFTFFGINIRSNPYQLLHACRSRALRSPIRQNLALINPALHANYAIGRVGLSEPVVDTRSQGVQRQPPLQIPFGSRDLRPVQTATDAHLDSLCAET